MKAIKRRSNFGNEFKRSVHLFIGTLYGVGACIPGEIFGAWSEGVAAGSAECMPVSNGKAEMFFHGFLSNSALGIIIFKRKRIVRLNAFKLDGLNTFKVGLVSECSSHSYRFCSCI